MDAQPTACADSSFLGLLRPDFASRPIHLVGMKNLVRAKISFSPRKFVEQTASLCFILRQDYPLSDICVE